MHHHPPPPISPTTNPHTHSPTIVEGDVETGPQVAERHLLSGRRNKTMDLRITDEAKRMKRVAPVQLDDTRFEANHTVYMLNIPKGKFNLLSAPMTPWEPKKDPIWVCVGLFFFQTYRDNNY